MTVGRVTPCAPSVRGYHGAHGVVRPTACQMMNRRHMLLGTAKVAGALGLSPCLSSLLAASSTRRFKIGACDWSIGRMANSSCFELAKEIGLDGVQVSLGTAGDDMKLRRPEVQKEFTNAASLSG